MIYRFSHICFLCYCLTLATIGCKKENEKNSSEANVLAFKSKFEGKYAIVSAVTDTAVDVNLDGKSSKSLLDELPGLKNSYLGLRINEGGEKNTFFQFWQNPSVRSDAGPVTIYDPQANVVYVNQATTGLFKLPAGAQDKLEVYRDNESPDMARDFPLPYSVRIQADGEIRVMVSKKVYTSSGLSAVNVNILYRRYTALL